MFIGGNVATQPLHVGVYWTTYLPNSSTRSQSKNFVTGLEVLFEHLREVDRSRSRALQLGAGKAYHAG